MRLPRRATARDRPYSQGLESAIGEHAPQPFHRPVGEALQPPAAQADLAQVDDHGEGQAEQRAELTVQPQAVAVEDQRGDDGLEQVVGERHAADAGQRRQPFSPGLLLQQENDGRNVKEHQRRRANGAGAAGNQAVVLRRRPILVEESIDVDTVEDDTNGQSDPQDLTDQQQMLANIVEDPALADVQAQEEHAKDVAKGVDEIGTVCEGFLDPETGDLLVGTRRVEALRIGTGAEKRGGVFIPGADIVHHLPRHGHHDGEEQDKSGRRQQHFSGAFAEEQQQESVQRVDAQDVSHPDEEGVQHAEDQEDEQTPQEDGDELRPPGLGPQHLHGHAPAEQQREERVELGLHQEADRGHQDAVEAGQPLRLVGGSAVAEHVGDQDAQHGEAAQDVHELHTFVGLNGRRSRQLPYGNRFRLGHDLCHSKG